MSAVEIPSFEHRGVPWRQTVRGGTIEDRRLTSIVTSIPPDIAELAPVLPPGLVAECDDAIRAMAGLDAAEGDHLKPLATLLLRAESVASSKIENESASIEDYARALYGIKANRSAVAMAAATGAMDRLLHGSIDDEGILAAHRLLMADEPAEAAYAGRWRTMQNWIEGSDHSPRNASYVPPPAELVAPKMADLMVFANRRDLPVVCQAAVAHAQFESIHPFTDGNGRIGRALAAAVIRQRGVARNLVIPIASALVARRDHYFDTLGAYRSGDAAPIVRAFARSATIASDESRTTAATLRDLPERWRVAAGNPRADSATSVLLRSLMAVPVVTSEYVETELGMPTATVHRAFDRLATAGILRPLTDRTRNQVWGAADILDELEDLGSRIAARARSAF